MTASSPMYFAQKPLQGVLLALGGAAAAASAGFARSSRLAAALALVVLGIALLVMAVRLMVRTPDWNAVDDWEAGIDVATRRNLILASDAIILVGAAAIWVGFGPGSFLSQVLLVVGGWAVLLSGVVGFTIWLRVRRRRT